MADAAKVPTPELDKLRGVAKTSQAIGEFLDWLESSGFVLAQHHTHAPDFDDLPEPTHTGEERGCYRVIDPRRDGCLTWDTEETCRMNEARLYPAITGGHERLLARYFEIDLTKADSERRALINAIRQPEGEPTKGDGDT